MTLKSSLKRGLAVAATVGLIGIGSALAAAPAIAADPTTVDHPLVLQGYAGSGTGYTSLTSFKSLASQAAIDAALPTLPLATFPVGGMTGPIKFLGGCLEAPASMNGLVTLATCSTTSRQQWTTSGPAGSLTGTHDFTNVGLGSTSRLAMDGSGRLNVQQYSYFVDFGAVVPVADVTINPVPGGTLSTEGATLSGTAQPGSAVSVTVGGVVVGSATAGTDGTWTAPVAIPAGNATVTVTAAGKSASVDVTVEAPIADVTINPVPGGTLSTEGATLSGTAEPGTSVVVTVDGVQVGTATAGTDGTWTAPVTIPAGAATVTVTAAGKSASVDVTVEVPAPVYEFAITSPGDTEAIAGDSVEFAGTAAPGTEVVITDGEGNPVATAIADDEGNWKTTVALVDGPQSFEVTDGTQTISISVTATVDNSGTPIIDGGVALGALVAAGALGMGITAKRRRLAAAA